MHFLVIVVCFFSSVLCAQVNGSYYWIEFKDKNNSPYSIERPEHFLSQKSLSRKAKMQIPIDQNDLPVSRQYIDGITQMGGVLRLSLKWFNGGLFQVADSSIIPSILSLPYVWRVEKRECGKVENFGQNKWQKKQFLPYDSKGFEGFSGVSYPGFKQLNLSCFHQLGYNGRGVHIAVFDAGFMGVDTIEGFAHLFEDNRVGMRYDFVHNSTDVFAQHSHGTSVLSVMAGRVGGSFLGTAPLANYHLFITEDVNSETLLEEYYWVKAAETADSLGIDIINSSLAYTQFDDSLTSHTYMDMDGNTTLVSMGAEMATQKGILVVNSAGNEGNDPWQYIGAPADAAGVLSVGATNANGILAGFSSNGPTYDGRIKPDVVAWGHKIPVVSANGSVNNSSGTSFSGPLMAGCMACLMQSCPKESNKTLVESVLMSSDKYSMPNNLYGHGVPDFQKAFELLQGKPLCIFSDEEYATVQHTSSGQLQIALQLKHPSALIFEVYSALGQRVDYFEGEGFVGENNFNRSFTPLGNGTYWLSIKTKTNRLSTAFVMVD